MLNLRFCRDSDEGCGESMEQRREEEVTADSFEGIDGGQRSGERERASKNSERTPQPLKI